MPLYKMLHLTGLVMAFMAIAGVLLRGLSGGDSSKGRGLAAATHGAGLLLALVGGFGMHARLGLAWQGWVFAKLGLWLAVGGLLTLAIRKPSTGLWWALVVVFASGAALGLFKPF